MHVNKLNLSVCKASDPALCKSAHYAVLILCCVWVQRQVPTDSPFDSLMSTWCANWNFVDTHCQPKLSTMITSRHLVWCCTMRLPCSLHQLAQQQNSQNPQIGICRIPKFVISGRTGQVRIWYWCSQPNAECGRVPLAHVCIGKRHSAAKRHQWLAPNPFITQACFLRLIPPTLWM